MQKKFRGGLICGMFLVSPIGAQDVPRIPTVQPPPPNPPITHHCPDDTGCPFPGGVIPEHTNAAPAYPASLRQAGDTGTVRLTFAVTPDGVVDPQSVKVTSATHPELGTAAAATVGAWRFTLLGSERRASSVPVRLTVQYILGGPCADGEGSAAWSEDRRSPRVVVTGCRMR